MNEWSNEGRALGTVRGVFGDVLKSTKNPNQDLAMQRLSACAVINTGQLARLNQTNHQMLAVQSEIAQGQQRLEMLGHEQVRIQSEMLNVQTQQLAIQKQQLVAQETSAIQLQIQTKLQMQQALHRERQKNLKEAAFEAKQKIASVSNCPDLVERFALLTQQTVSMEQVGLVPNELEELQDKEYTNEVVNGLAENLRQVFALATDDEKKDIQFLLEFAGLRRQLYAASANANANIQNLSAHQAARNNEIASIESQLAQRSFAQTLDRLLPQGPQALPAKVFRGGLAVAAWIVLVIVGGMLKFPAVGGIGFLIGAVLMGMTFMADDPEPRLRARLDQLKREIDDIERHGEAAMQGANQAEGNRAAMENQIGEFLQRHPALQSFF